MIWLLNCSENISDGLLKKIYSSQALISYYENKLRKAPDLMLAYSQITINNALRNTSECLQNIINKQMKKALDEPPRNHWKHLEQDLEKYWEHIKNSVEKPKVSKAVQGAQGFQGFQSSQGFQGVQGF